MRKKRYSRVQHPTRHIRVSGFDLAWFSSLSSKRLCVFHLYGAMYILKKFCLHPSLYLLVSWARWDWPLTWLTNHRPSVLWHCWLGHVTRKTVSKMTYNVSSGTLNSTIPYNIMLITTIVTYFYWQLFLNALYAPCSVRWNSKFRTVLNLFLSTWIVYIHHQLGCFNNEHTVQWHV